eukprot:JP440915.1.p2 GENE.JP440915.1~~JP440915.1.p2  ORF type:complete len:82 (+),score=17.16 JP440915.1:37-246(+)
MAYVVWGAGTFLFSVVNIVPLSRFIKSKLGSQKKEKVEKETPKVTEKKSDVSDAEKEELFRRMVTQAGK